jgi:hypothetical protein
MLRQFLTFVLVVFGFCGTQDMATMPIVILKTFDHRAILAYFQTNHIYPSMS